MGATKGTQSDRPVVQNSSRKLSCVEHGKANLRGVPGQQQNWNDAAEQWGMKIDQTRLKLEDSLDIIYSRSRNAIRVDNHHTFLRSGLCSVYYLPFVLDTSIVTSRPGLSTCHASQSYGRTEIREANLCQSADQKSCCGDHSRQFMIWIVLE